MLITFSSLAGVQGSLTGLYQTIEARLALYKPLASLQGRLDLVLAQAAPVDPLASHLAAGPMVSLATLSASKPYMNSLCMFGFILFLKTVKDSLCDVCTSPPKCQAMPLYFFLNCQAQSL